MSIRVFGILELNSSDLPSKEQEIRNEVKISFLVVECATRNKLGVKLGGNVFPNFLKNIKSLSGLMPFELADDPMDVNAECLFSGEGATESANGVRVDTGESLSTRMLRVQSFLNELLKTKHVNKIVLDINIEEGEIETIEVNINNFCSKMLELYEREENWTPRVRVVIIPS